MKRHIAILSVIVLLLLSSYGCASDNSLNNSLLPTTSKQSDKPAYTLAREIAIQTISTFLKQSKEMLPDAIISSTNKYTLRRIDGQCYVDIVGGNERLVESNEGCILPAPLIRFGSIDKLYRTLMAQNDNLDSLLDTIRRFYPLNKEYGFLIADPASLVSVQMPDGFNEFNVTTNGTEYKFAFRTETSDPILGYNSVDVNICPEESFISFLTGYFTFQSGESTYDSTFDIPERNATAYEKEHPAGRWRYVQYCIKTDTKILFVEERYCVRRNDPTLPASETDPLEIKIYGFENNVFFTIDPGKRSGQELIDLLNGIHIVDYSPET